MADVLRPGSRLGSYRIEELVARGGMAYVYRAEHSHLRRQVALKIPIPELAADESFRDRFIRESQAVAAMHHPNLISVYDAGEIDGVLFLAMQFVEGVDLGRIIQRDGAQSPERACEIVCQVAGALDVAHARGLIHRDVKPANVLVDGSWCLLADFGLTKLEDDAGGDRTATGALLGSLPYAAPEQIEGTTVDRRVDVYALGCLAFECLVGEKPFTKGSSAALVYAHLTEPPPRPSERRPGVPAAVDAVIARAMAKVPANRYRTCGELAAALSAALDPRAEAPTAVVAELPTPVETRVPLPGLLARSAQKGLVGRSAEIEALREAVNPPEAGTRIIFCLIGEPGIGKTHLAAHVAQEAYDAGAVVLYGRAEDDAVIPYEPLVEALRHYCGHADVFELERALETHLDVLAPLIPELAPVAAGRTADRSEPDRYQLFEGMVSVFEHAGRAGPLLLVLEDLHWADKETLLMLRHIVHSRGTLALTVVLTYRDLELPATHPLRGVLADLGREHDVRAIDVEGLGPAEVAELATKRGGHEVTVGYARFLHEQTSGNPFFIEELARAGDTGSLRAGLSLGGDSLTAVPPGVRRVIQRRLARLSSETRDVLAIAALLGRDFGLGVLAAVTNARGDELLDALEEAVGAGLLTEHPESADHFSFCHALVRDVLTAETTVSRRRRLHERIAEGLERRRERLGIEPAELAAHFFEARGLGHDEKALRYSLEAGRRAVESHADELACRAFRQALTVLDDGAETDDRERADLLLDLGAAMWRASEPGARDVFHDAADLSRSTGSPEHLARAALGLGGRFYAPGAPDEAYAALLAEALETLGEADDPLRVRLLSRLAEALVTTSHEPRALELSEQAVDIANRLTDRDALLAALAGRHAAMLDADHLDSRASIARERVALADELGQLEASALARHWLLHDLFERGELDTARQVLAALEDLAARLHQPLYRHSVLAWHGVAALLDDRLDQAESFARQSLDVAERAGSPEARAHFTAQLLLIRRRQGREAELLSDVEEITRRHFWFDGLGAVLPRLYAAAGDDAAGAEAFEALAADDFAGVPRGPFRLAALVWLAEASVALGRRADGETLHALLLPHANHFVQAGFTGSLGPLDQPLEALTTATRQSGIPQ